MSSKPQLRIRELNILGIPALTWFIFFSSPHRHCFSSEFSQKGTYGGLDWIFQLSNYPRIFEIVYFKIFYESFKLSLVTSILC